MVWNATKYMAVVRAGEAELKELLSPGEMKMKRLARKCEDAEALYDKTYAAWQNDVQNKELRQAYSDAADNSLAADNEFYKEFGYSYEYQRMRD